MNKNINMDIIIMFVNSMAKEDMKALNISNSTLYKYKQNTKNIYKAKYETLLKIQHYIQKYKTNIVGIDLGLGHYLAASNIDRSLIYVDSKNVIYQLFQKHKNRVNDKTFDNVLAYNKLKTALINYINQEINQLLKVWNEPINIFVLGTHNYSNVSFPSLIFDITYHALKAKMGTQDQIVIVDESCTSIECPICMYRDKHNRSKSNHFKCKNCGYFHDNDDIVAASNIAKKGLEKIKNKNN